MVKILPINDDALDEAAAVLRAGGLVAFPTETVYGLGADATDSTAVARIFEAKKRPSFNPLICHFPTLHKAWERVAADPRAHRLASEFWPGALTMVLPMRPDSGLSPLVSAGLPTAAVRVPADPRAQALLARCMRPVAAPSANRSGAISPTTARHVADSLGDAVDLILDGGPCPVGVESTILDLTGAETVLLRPGGVPEEDLSACLGTPVTPTAATAKEREALKSPGLMRSHYAPNAAVRLNAAFPGDDEVYLAFGPDAPAGALNLSERGDLREAAANLFAHLHALDTADAATIAVAPIPETGLGRAINDRLRRAAAPRENAH